MGSAGRAYPASLATLTGVATGGESITWYDVLGVSSGADRDTVRDAYAQRSRQLRPELLNGAPSPVLLAAERAAAAVKAAWLVLSDPGRRRRYDREVGASRGGGLRGTDAFGGSSSPSGAAGSGAASGPLVFGTELDLMLNEMPEAAGAVLDIFATLTPWTTPLPAAPSRRITVPELRGLFFRACRDVVTTAGLRLAVERLTEDPMPVEGLVVGQSEKPGSHVRRKSTLTVQVWHPPRHNRAPASLGVRHH
jgi:DnaJ domain/PASTA domain